MVHPGQIKLGNRRVDCPYPSADSLEIIGRILHELEASELLTDLSFEIASAVEGTMWVVGRWGRGIAATCVYAAGVLIGGSEPIYNQKDVSKASGLSNGTLSKYHGEILEIYEAFGNQSES